jgi:iron-sulfur cluster assembly protein
MEKQKELDGMINITEKAATKIQNYIQRRGRGVGVVIGVKTTGCSGLAYVLEYIDEITKTPGAIDYEHSNFIVRVDEKALPYVNGMTIDYVKNGLNEGFEFNNPNERDRCGCGESFRV